MKTTLKCVTAALVLAVGAAGSASADEVNVIGYTNGCFGAACAAPNSPATQSTSTLGLTYQNSNFNNTTVGGFLALGGSPTDAPTLNTNNLGSFRLLATENVYNTSFTLRIVFTAPTVIGGSGPNQTFVATVTGAVSGTGTGGVLIDFSQTPIVYNFANGATSGSFTLTIQDAAIDPGQLVSLNATITGAQQTTTIPEPATMTLLATGLAGLVLAGRMKRKSQK